MPESLLTLFDKTAVAIRDAVAPITGEERRARTDRPGQYAIDVVADRAALEILHRVPLTVVSEESGITGTPNAPVTVTGLNIDPARREVRVNDREVELTAHEFDLLYVLASNRGIVFSRDALVQRVWGGDTHITERSVDTLVKRLRKKIEDDPAEPRYISTVWGTGYKFIDV